MKIVVFGGSGFVGSHVCDVLTDREYDVAIFDLKKSPYLRKGQRMAVGDIMDSQAVEEAVRGANAVYHFAGVADIDEAKVNPAETVRQNVLGTTILLEACCKHNIGRFLFASSVYVYSNAGSFYRTTKQACELLIEDYQRARGLPFTIMRYGSLYGPRADRKNWIYSILKDAVTKGKIVRNGDGEEIREYIHVHDAARISVDLLDKQYENQHVIISGSQPMKIKDLLMMIKEIMNRDLKIEYIPARYDGHYEITPYSFNPRIAKRVLASSYLDLGQGILDMLQTIHEESLGRSRDGNVSLNA